jgi:hypothetical protein
MTGKELMELTKADSLANIADENDMLKIHNNKMMEIINKDSELINTLKAIIELQERQLEISLEQINALKVRLAYYEHS